MNLCRIQYIPHQLLYFVKSFECPHNQVCLLVEAKCPLGGPTSDQFFEDERGCCVQRECRTVNGDNLNGEISPKCFSVAIRLMCTYQLPCR